MKQWLSRIPLRGKLLLLAAVVTGIALVLAGVVLVYFAHAASSEALLHRLETQARIMALNSSAALAFEDTSAARSTLDALNSRGQTEATLATIGIIAGGALAAGGLVLKNRG